MQWGNRLVSQFSLAELVPHVNRHVLFQYHWGLNLQTNHAEAVFDRLIAEESQYCYIRPAAVSGLYTCEVDRECLLIYADFDSQTPLMQLSFPRQGRGEHLCITDFFKPIDQYQRSLIAFQAVTIGQPSSDYEQQLFTQDRYQEYLYRYGFHAALTEALAEFLTDEIHREANESKKINSVKRYSFGYSCCPDMTQQKLLLNLLDASQVGMSETETHQLIRLLQ